MSVSMEREVGFPKYKLLEADQGNMSALPRCDKAQRGLLVMAAVGSLLWCIPPLRFGVGLAMKSIALLSSSVSATDRWAKNTVLERNLKVAKIAAVALGLVGLAAASPMLIIASLSADLAIQIIETFKAFVAGEWQKGLMHLAMGVVDVLAWGAIVAGSWELMVAATCVGILAMLILTIKNVYECYKSPSEVRFFDALLSSAITLITLSMAGSAVKELQGELKKETRAHFHTANGSSVKQTFTDKHGHVLATLRPGEEGQFSVPVQDMFDKPIPYRTIQIHYADGQVANWGTGSYSDVYTRFFRTEDLLSVPTLGTGIVLNGLMKEKATAKPVCEQPILAQA